jgi:glycosyltransferase involved in cell wall biosynthesis
VVIEAAAMGVPTVGTNIYGLSDAVEQGETGLLISPFFSNFTKLFLLSFV